MSKTELNNRIHTHKHTHQYTHTYIKHDEQNIFMPMSFGKVKKYKLENQLHIHYISGWI